MIGGQQGRGQLLHRTDVMPGSRFVRGAAQGVVNYHSTKRRTGSIARTLSSPFASAIVTPYSGSSASR